MQNCKKCGALNNDNAKFCNNCGLKLEQLAAGHYDIKQPIWNSKSTEEPYTSAPKPVSYPSKNSKRKLSGVWITIIVISCVLFGCCILGIIVSVLNPNRTVNNPEKNSFNSTIQVETTETIEKTTQVTVTETTKIATIPETTIEVAVQEPFELSAGTYVIGEDLIAGKYDIDAIKGSATISIYDSLDTYKSEDYFSYRATYALATEDSSAMEYWPDSYSTTASNVRLNDGECLVIESGISLKFTEKDAKVLTEDELQEPFELSTGTYVIGEDLLSGKYDMVARKGSASLYIFDSLDTYENGDYFSYNEAYALATEDSSAMEYWPDSYSTTASNVRLNDGECLIIESGIIVELVKK